MSEANKKKGQKDKRKKRIRKKIFGTGERLRLSVSRSLNHFYAQIIDDEKSHTLLSASTLSAEIRDTLKKKANKEAAERVGEFLAKKALNANIKEVCFDRNGFLFHGRVKAFADGCKKGGLIF